MSIMIMPASGVITGRPGNRCSHGNDPDHRGFDIANKSGGPILAAASGTVTESRAGGTAGNMVWINHGGGWSTRYFHLRDASPLKKGQQVTQGAEIGRMGTTGRSTGVHLHFEIRHNTNVVQDNKLFSNFPCHAEVNVKTQLNYTFAGLPGPDPIKEGFTMSEADRVIDYIRALLVSGYTWEGQNHPGIGMVVEENQRRIGRIPHAVWKETEVRRADGQISALQELADIKTISLAVQAVVDKLAEQNGLSVDQIRDAVDEGVTSAVGQLSDHVAVDAAAPEPHILAPENHTGIPSAGEDPFSGRTARRII